MAQSLYDILGIDKNANQAEIKAAHRKLSKKYHPDLQGNKSEDEKKVAEEKFKEIQHAYDVLSDEDKKARYDMFGTEDGAAGGQSGFGDFGDFHFDFGGNGFNFSDLRDMFGGGRSRHQERVVPGRSHQMEVLLSIEDVYKGCSKTVKYTINKRCPNCHGKGGETHKCPHCNGTGVETKTVRTAFGTQITQTVCSHCNGTGDIIDKSCPSCGGTGFRPKEVTLDINFPAGISNGIGINYQGKGSDAKKPGHPQGDFIAIAKWNFDTDRYTINGFDILEKIEIPYEDAILGTKYRLVLPDKKEVEVTITQGTAPGKRYVLRGKGIKGKDMYGREVIGNYLIEVVYKIPVILDDEEREALNKIKKIHTND